MAFPETPLGLRGELLLGGSWVDITRDIYTREPIRIVHGTANEGTQPDPASCALLLNNAGGKYSPRNPLGEYHGRLLRNSQLRITVPAEESWLRLDGGHASTPHSAALATSGDLDLRAEVTPDDWIVHGRVWPIISRWEGSAIGYRLSVLSDGTLELAWSSTGTSAGLRAAVSTVPVDGRGGRLCVRAVLDVDNGAGGCTATFYSGPTTAGPWTTIGEPVVSAGTTSVANPSTPLVLGTMLGLPYPGIALAGRVHRAEVRAGIDGAVLADPDFTGLEDGAAGVTDSAGRVWSLTGAAVVSRREPLFTGEVSDWPARWTGAGHDAYVPIQAAGILRRLGQGRRPLESTLRRRIPSARGLLAYWPMEDAEGSTSLYSPTPGVRPLRVSGMALAADESLPGSAPLPTLNAAASMSAAVPAAPTPGWHVEMVYHLPTLPAALTEILRVTIAGSAARSAHVLASTAGIRIEARDAEGEVLAFFTYTNAAAIADFAGVWNRLSVYVSAEPSGQTRLTAAWRDIASGGFWRASTIFTGTMGTLAGIAGTWGTGTEGMTLGHLGAFSVPGASAANGGGAGVTIYAGADNGYAHETAVDRVRRLSVEEPLLRVSAWDGDIDTPAERMGPQGRTELLTLLGEVVDTDAGILAEPMDRLGLVYRDRATLYNQPPALTLDYAAGQVAPPLDPAEDDADRPNDVTVTRAGGSSGRVVIEEGPNSALPPEAGGIGAYEEAVTLSLGSDGQARPIAGWRAHLGTWDEARYPTVRVELHRRPELIPDVLRLRVGDLVRITNPPVYTGPGPLDLIVRQIEHEPRPRAWVLTLGCTPAGPYGVGVVGDAVRGRVDTAGTVLGADVSASAGHLVTRVTAGRPWVTAAPNVVADAGFEAGTAAWACSRGSSIGAVSWDRDIVHTGTGAARLTRVHVSDTGTLNLIPGVVYPAAPGQAWAAHAWVYNGSLTARDMRMGIVWRDNVGADTFILPAATSVVPGQWVRLEVAGTLPAGAVSVYPSIVGGSGWTVGEWWVADSVRLACTDTVTIDDDDFEEFPFGLTVGGEQVTVTAIGPAPADDFDRTVAGGWGTSSSGHAWQVAPAATAPHFAVSGGVATIAVDALNTTRRAYLPDTVQLADVDVRVTTSVPALATGGNIESSIMLRVDPADVGNSYYYGEIEFNYQASATVRARIMRRQGGTDTALSTALDIPGLTYTAGSPIRMRFRAVGPELQLKAWPGDAAEPSGWAVEVTDTALTAGRIGVRAILDPPNTNVLPLAVSYSDFSVGGDQVMTVTRAVNNISKGHAAGADVRLAHPTIVAL
ncbi:hypothetical protein [Streptomyces sp. NPDC096095]|uniref:hypothetical protein n=1 Tax=Streptomyces sp. NPDC096095 TaxID=3155545 RepID=UPI003317000D